MPDPADQVAELLSVPLEQLLTALGRGIGEAQAALDRHSIEIQQLIDSDPVLGQYGLQASWYQIPSTELDLKIAVAVEQPAAPAQNVALPAPDLGLGRALPRLWAQPINARYVNQFAYDVQASSSVRLTVVPVPPPASVTTARPTHAADDVLATVRDRLITFEQTVRGRVSVNFNPASRSWFVLQTEQDGLTTVLLKLLRIDDETLSIIREEPVDA
ncbi:hypothetical protein [Frankia sp. Cr2]|uniref:hypothetical protein n=1 Tax=Frankia sp. Cr2 TaxID=3073932 RepID=UPI002AD28620|nr:hypothetical protein [Frankia sp. Cr2]